MTPWGIEFIRTNGRNVRGHVLEVGSKAYYSGHGHILLRTLFPDVDSFMGIDIEPGDNVDQVMSVLDLDHYFGPERFDCVLSGDALEHIEDWKTALQQMWTVLVHDGLLLFTTVAKGKRRHNYPNDYHRFSLADFEKIFIEEPIVALGRRGHFVGAAIRKKSVSLKLDNIEVLRVPPE